MSYIYRLKTSDEGVKEKLIELGYDKLPVELCPAPQNENFLYKVVMQPKDGECVNSLIAHYNAGADFICKDKKLREVYASIGIKFKKPKGKPRQLILTDELLDMFSAWRLEISLSSGEVYFTIADDSIRSFYDAEVVLERYCPSEVEELVINDLIVKEEIKEPKEEIKEPEEK